MTVTLKPFHKLLFSISARQLQAATGNDEIQKTAERALEEAQRSYPDTVPDTRQKMIDLLKCDRARLVKRARKLRSCEWCDGAGRLSVDYYCSFCGGESAKARLARRLLNIDTHLASLGVVAAGNEFFEVVTK